MQLFAACTHHGRKGGRRQLPLIVVAIVVGSFAAVLILWLAMSESTRDVVTKRKPDSTVSSRNATHSESDSRAAASTVAEQLHGRQKSFSSATTASPWVEVPIPGSARQHDFRQQLPPGASLFCPAHDDPSMEVMKYLEPNPDDPPNITVAIDGCKHPIRLMQFPGVNMYPDMKCGAVKPWRVIEFPAVRQEQTSRAGSMVVVESCLRECLTSMCCLAFAVTQAMNGHPRCTLNFCDYTKAHHFRMPVELMSNGTSYVIAHRREYRPSLVRQDLRILLLRGPPTTIRTPSSIPPDPAIMEELVLPVSAVIVAEHGVLAQPRNGTMRVKCHFPDMPGVFNVARMVDEFPIVNGRSQFDIRLVQIVPRNYTPILGGRVAFEFMAILDDGKELVYRAYSKLQRNGTTAIVEYQKRGVDNNHATCAPLLVDGECCLRTVRAKTVLFVPPDEFVTSPLFMPATNEKLEYRLVELSLLKGVNRTAADCVRLVDGFHGHIDSDGIAEFTNLVIRVNRTAESGCLELLEESEEESFITLQGRSTYRTDPIAWSAEVRIPMRDLRDCGLRAPDAGGPTMPSKDHNESATTSRADDLPILVSVPAHECFECLVTFVRNLRRFVWPSIVVLHFPIGTAINMTEMELLNASHPAVHVNTDQVDSVIGVRLLHIHGLNVHHAITRLPHLRFSHALFLASNEMFVRHGVVDYIRRHDFVWMEPPTPLAGAIFEHNSNGRRLWMEQQFFDVEDLVRRVPRKWGFVWPDAVHADHWIAAAMRKKGLTKYPRDTLLLEGTFMNRQLAEEFSNEIMTMFPPETFCEDPMLYPHCEIITPTTFQHVCSTRPGIRCGFRVTTMLWKNFMWTATLDDVRRVRCSPFEVPFGFKRVPRDLRDPVRTYIQQLEGKEPTQRDLNTSYCFEAPHPMREDVPDEV